MAVRGPVSFKYYYSNMYTAAAYLLSAMTAPSPTQHTTQPKKYHSRSGLKGYLVCAVKGSEPIVRIRQIKNSILKT